MPLELTDEPYYDQSQVIEMRRGSIDPVLKVKVTRFSKKGMGVMVWDPIEREAAIAKSDYVKGEAHRGTFSQEKRDSLNGLMFDGERSLHLRFDALSSLEVDDGVVWQNPNRKQVGGGEFIYDLSRPLEAIYETRSVVIRLISEWIEHSDVFGPTYVPVQRFVRHGFRRVLLPASERGEKWRAFFEEHQGDKANAFTFEVRTD